MFIKCMAFLFLLSSCALFKGGEKIETKDTEKLLNSFQFTGEGRGRLSLGQNQYVFSFESLLKENHDWIIGVSIPLQGEEVMILPDLKQKEMKDSEFETFEKRIRDEFKRVKLDKALSAEKFLNEMRSLVRFAQASALHLLRKCSPHLNEFKCELDGEFFLVSVKKDEFIVQKILEHGRSVVLEGRNLTESFFSQSNFHLYISNKDFELKKSSFSLELFWK